MSYNYRQHRRRKIAAITQGGGDWVYNWDFVAGDDPVELQPVNNVAGTTARDNLFLVQSGQLRTQAGTGLLVEPQRSNKCTKRNFTMPDTTGMVADAAWTTFEVLDRSALPAAILTALEGIDSQGRVTKVLHGISNGAGVITYPGVTGNTNSHVTSQFQYVVSGDFGSGVAGAPSADPTTGEWIRQFKTGTPSGAADVMVSGSTQASEAYWFGFMMEEGEERTSVIENTTDAVTTRQEDRWFADTNETSRKITDAASIFGSATRHSIENKASSYGFFQLDNGTENNRIYDLSPSTNGALNDLAVSDGGVLQAQYSTAGFWDLDTIHTVGITATTDSVNAALDGVLQTEDTNASFPGGLRFFRAGSRSFAQTTWHGYIRQLVLFNKIDNRVLLGIGEGGFDSGFDTGFS